MWFTALKCLIGAIVFIAVCGWAVAPVTLPGLLAAGLVAFHWKQPLKSFPASLWLSSVFWFSAAVVLLFVLANPAEMAGLVALVAIGIWDMGAASLDVKE